MSLTYFIISILIVICDHVHYKAFDHVNISKDVKFVTCLFVYLLADDVILLTKLVPDCNCT